MRSPSNRTACTWSLPLLMVSVLVRADFPSVGESSRRDMSRSRNVGGVARYRRFESGFLQRRVCKPSVPREIDLPSFTPAPEL
jgi:hypothetical protein